MREFESWRPNAGQRERVNLSPAYPVLSLLRASMGIACTRETIVKWFEETQGVAICPKDVGSHLSYARQRGLVPFGEAVWAIFGVGYVCLRGKVPPSTLGEIDVSVFCPPASDREHRIAVPGTSLLMKGKIEATTDPSSDRIIEAFNALWAIEGFCLKPSLVGEGRRLVACLANAGGEELAMRKLISGLGREYIPGDDNLIRTKFRVMRDVLEPYGLGIEGKREFLGPKKGTPGSSTYRLHNL